MTTTPATSRLSIRQRRVILAQAAAGLAENTERERTAGITGETPEFLRLNGAVDDALHTLPWWARVVWGGDWRWFLRHPRAWD